MEVMRPAMTKNDCISASHSVPTMYRRYPHYRSACHLDIK